jgi:hypothetical protein
VTDVPVVDAREWIDRLGGELVVQARLLRGLLDAIEPDPVWEWAELSCSVAEGRGDAMSDLDLGLGHRGEQPPPVAAVTDLLTGLSDVVEVADAPWDDFHRWWVQYENGGQVDLVVMPAAVRPGRAPGSVALLDRTGQLAETFTPGVWTACPDDPRRWLLDGWEALSNVNKYLRRGSVLEAVDQLARARQRIFQLWAAGEGVPYPSFGLTSLLDHPATLPPDIAATYATPDGSAVGAALSAAHTLAAAGRHAQPGLDTPLRAYVIGRLAAVQTSDGG